METMPVGENLKDSIKECSERGKSLLNEAAATHEEETFQSAIQQFTKAYKRALLLNSDRELERKCLFNLGASYVAAGYHVRGVHVLKSVLQVTSQTTQSNPFKCDILFNIGHAHDQMEDYDTAIMYYKAAMTEYRQQTNYDSMMCETLVNLAKIYVAKQDHTQARGFYTDAANVYLQQNMLEDACRIMIYKVEAMLPDKKSGIEECKAVLEDCLEKSLKISNLDGKSKVLNEIGMKYTVLCEYGKALDIFNLALHSCGSESKNQIALTLQNMGAIHNRLKQYQNAVDTHESAIRIHGELGNRNAQAQCFCSLAYAQSQLGFYQVAGENFLHALQAFKDTGDKYGQWQVHEGLAGICMVRGHVTKAIEHYQHAIKIQAEAKDMNLSSQNRLIQKLTNALMLRSKKKNESESSDESDATPRYIAHQNKKILLSASKPINENVTVLDSSQVARDGIAKVPTKYTRTKKHRNNTYKRGRRGYSDDEYRPVNHIARGLSSLTERSVQSPDYLQTLQSRRSQGDGALWQPPFVQETSSDSD